MDFLGLAIKFIILMFVVCGGIIIMIRRALVTSTEGAVNRLNGEIAKANAKQEELNKKLKEADEELAKRKAEAKELAEKMRSDAEEESKAEREKIIAKAREEGEEIIAKAQGAKEKLREDLEKETDLKALNFGIEILNKIFVEKAKNFLNQDLISEFLENLKNTDMSKISPDVNEAEIVIQGSLDESVKSQFAQVIKEKLGREVSVKATTDDSIGGGIILKFGSMALDGSIKNLIREAGVELQEKVEASV